MTHPAKLYIRLSDNHQLIRKWSLKPFEHGEEYELKSITEPENGDAR